jgi:hypothetical protein
VLGIPSASAPIVLSDYFLDSNVDILEQQIMAFNCGIGGGGKLYLYGNQIHSSSSRI